MIPISPPPTLREADKWSTDFKTFIGYCLQKNPAHRYLAGDLLKLPFITKAPSTGEVMAPLIREAAEIVALHGRFPRSQASDDEDEGAAESGTIVGGANAATIVPGGGEGVVGF